MENLIQQIVDKGFPVKNKSFLLYTDSPNYGDYISIEELITEVKKLDKHAQVKNKTWEDLARLWLALRKKTEKKHFHVFGHNKPQSHSGRKSH